MALSSEYIARAFSQALGIISAGGDIRGGGRGGRGGFAVSAIARRLYDNNRSVPGATYSSYAAVARRAASAVELAERMGDNTAYRPGVREHPQVDTLYPDTERYRYAVAVTYTGRGGNEAVARGEVISDTPLTAAEIDAQVRARIDYSESAGRSTRSALAKVGAGRSVAEVVILAATRVY